MSTTDDTNDVECPTCGRDDFDSEHAVKVHRGRAHNQEGKPWQDPGKLEELYWEEELSAEEVADRLGCAQNTVLEWLENHGLGTRTITEASQNRWEDRREPWCERELMRELYVGKELSTHDIAERFGCHPSTVKTWLDKHDISTRPSGREKKSEKLSSEAWLRRAYWGEEMSLSEIGEVVGRSPQNVGRWMDKFDIPRRGREESLPTGEDHHNHGMSERTPDQLSDGEWLRQKYLQEGKSIRDIAGLLECSRGAVRHALSLAEVPVRDRGCLSGEDHPHYDAEVFTCPNCGEEDEAPQYRVEKYEQLFCSNECRLEHVQSEAPGAVSYRGSDWKTIAAEIRERDGHQCVQCGASSDEQQERYGRALNVHHITPFREFDTAEEANHPANLVTLCSSCHTRVEQGPLEAPTPT